MAQGGGKTDRAFLRAMARAYATAKPIQVSE
jgi:hypothetical protein